jgi:outer membrane protein insertion porin family
MKTKIKPFEFASSSERILKPMIQWVITIFLISGVVQSLHGQENYVVRSIDFKGNESLEKDYLLERLAVREVSYIEQLITDKQPFLFNRELVELDIERLKTLYQSEGFLDVRTELGDSRLNNNRKTVKLDFNIVEGDAIIVDTVFLYFKESEDNLPDSLYNILVGKLELDKGTRFSDKALKNDVETITDFFQDRGYAYAKVKYDLDVRKEEFETDIEYSIEKGPLCQFGETIINGNEYFSDDYILKQLNYKEGDKYRKSKLRDSRLYLYSLQVFRIVSIVPKKDSENFQNPIPVEIFIEESPKWSTKFGAGYGTEDKFRAFADLNRRGLLGGARRINLYLKHSALEPYVVSLRWIQPHFLTRDLSLTLNPYINKKAEPGFETRTFGINIPLTYRHNNTWSSSISYYLEDVEQTVEEGDVELPDFEDDKFPYNKSGILLNTIFDNSSPRFSPHEGIHASLGFKINGYILGGTFSYTRLWGEFRTYKDIGPFILAYRLMMGGISSSDTSNFIPVEDRFYAGGSTSVRGWRRADLGPKRQSGSPLGGKSLLETNLEIRYFLFWKLSIVAFLDSGNVWTGSWNYKLNELAYATGGGLRFETPIGPVRFDVGVPIWNEKKSPQFFLSVGQAF